MKRSPKNIPTFVLLLTAAGCMTVGDDGLPDVDSDPVLEETQIQCSQSFGAAPGCSEQGRTLLSKVLDTKGYLSFPLVGQSPGGPVALQIGATGGLELAGGRPLPSGLTVTASNGAVVGVQPMATPKGEPGPQYALTYSLDEGPVSPCVHGRAIVIAGDFDDTAHRDERTIRGGGGLGPRFSFACIGEGVASKCVAWGYPADRTPGSDAWKAFQTCTRAGRNDYCRNGGTFTLDETYVRIHDDFDDIGFDEPPWPFSGLNQWPPPVGVFKFESVWPDDDQEPPFCLSKTRWQALAPDALDGCDIRPRDPRQDSTAKFCDQVTDPDEEPGFPLHSIVFESQYTDLRLEEWLKGNDRAVSVTGYYPDGSTTVTGKRPFGNAAGFTHVRTLGTLLRSLPGSIDESEVINVYTYDDGGLDHVLAGPTGVTWIPPFNVGMNWEGMVFAAPPASGVPPTAPLYAYESAATGDFYNGTEPAAPADAASAQLIGYIIVRE